ncbi:MAG TPA: glycosyltransferase family 2 protein [Terriglobia bacterium]|nr:glycosyltransferase family 2 protein [Terriglobia bacterium]
MDLQAKLPPGCSSSSERPLVSVILAVLNEAAHIRQCIDSLLNQEAQDFDLEILAIDGMSKDGTKEILQEIAATEPRLRVLENQQRRTPFAFNLGLRGARGEYICIFGSHTSYRKDYISVCLKELIAQNAVACVGRIVTRPANATLGGQLVAWAVSHPFGSSRKSFRTQREGFSETANYPVARKAAFLEVGGFSEQLLRNQDNDMGQKLRAKGHKFYCTWKTECYYYPAGSLKDLLAYVYRTGFWNVISFKKNFACMGIRHFVPFLFLIALLSTSIVAAGRLLFPPADAVLASLPFRLLLGLHLAAGSVSALQVAWRERAPAALCLPFVFLGLHLAYGFGSLCAFVRGARIPSLPPESPAEAKGLTKEALSGSEVLHSTRS